MFSAYWANLRSVWTFQLVEYTVLVRLNRSDIYASKLLNIEQYRQIFNLLCYSLCAQTAYDIFCSRLEQYTELYRCQVYIIYFQFRYDKMTVLKKNASFQNGEGSLRTFAGRRRNEQKKKSSSGSYNEFSIIDFVWILSLSFISCHLVRHP